MRVTLSPLAKMGQLKLLVGLVVFVLLGSVQHEQVVAADEGVGRNLKYFKSMSFPNQVRGVVGTREVGDLLDKVCYSLIGLVKLISSSTLVD